MVYKSRILESARHELENIVSYLAEYSKDAARSFLDAYESQLDPICSSTVSYGLSRMPELALLGYHTALVGDYLFLYYIENDTVIVAHLFHQRQNYTTLVTAQEQKQQKQGR